MKQLLIFLFLLFFFFYGNTKNNLSNKDVAFLESLSPQVAPDIIPYSFIAIKPKKSYPKSLYEKADKKLLYEQNKNRIKQAKLYEENGNIDDFIEILLDLFTQFNYSLLAPEAAMLLGDFEYLIYNLDAALLYYLYVVNNHFYSPWGEEAYLKLGLTLSKKQHFLEATKIMKEILSETEDIDSQKQAKDFLQKRYLLLAKVAYQDEEYEKAKKYLEDYYALE